MLAPERKQQRLSGESRGSGAIVSLSSGCRLLLARRSISIVHGRRLSVSRPARLANWRTGGRSAVAQDSRSVGAPNSSWPSNSVEPNQLCSLPTSRAESNKCNSVTQFGLSARATNIKSSTAGEQFYRRHRRPAESRHLAWLGSKRAASGGAAAARRRQREARLQPTTVLRNNNNIISRSSRSRS